MIGSEIDDKVDFHPQLSLVRFSSLKIMVSSFEREVKDLSSTWTAFETFLFRSLPNSMLSFSLDLMAQN